MGQREYHLAFSPMLTGFQDLLNLTRATNELCKSQHARERTIPECLIDVSPTLIVHCCFAKTKMKSFLTHRL